MESNASRAKRLGYILKQYSESPDAVSKIAKALNYVPSTLENDMKAIIDYINELEENNHNSESC